MTTTRTRPEFANGVDADILVERMRTLQTRKREQGSRLTLGGLIDRLGTYTAFESVTPASFWISASDARAVDRLTAAAVVLTGRADPDALRELVESVAALHKMRPTDVLALRIQDAVGLIA